MRGDRRIGIISEKKIINGSIAFGVQPSRRMSVLVGDLVVYRLSTKRDVLKALDR